MSNKYFYIAVAIVFSTKEKQEIRLSESNADFLHEKETEKSVFLRSTETKRIKRISKDEINVVIADNTFLDTSVIKFYMWVDSEDLVESSMKELKLHAYKHVLTKRDQLLSACKKQVDVLNEEIIKLL